MVGQGALSHQYAGEADLDTRVGQEGAHFRVVAENLAVAPNPGAVEVEWMHSPLHRRNILDARLNEIGIGLVRQGGTCGQWKTSLPASPQSALRRLNSPLASCSAVVVSSREATLLRLRQTCAMDHGSAGAVRPKFVNALGRLRSDRLPDVLESADHTGRFRTAASEPAIRASNAARLHHLSTGRDALLEANRGFYSMTWNCLIRSSLMVIRIQAHCHRDR